MARKGVDLGNVILDDAGRAILSEEVLAGVEASFETPTAGGLNGLCNGSSNGTCYNSTACSSSSNRTDCTNQTQCDGASNPSSCYGYLDIKQQ